MARNEEKSQSMLYRFREAQAAELGLSQKTDRRPRVASSCKDLRQCERWRGEILREISRKVSKIQDAGLTDYEVRDLNDEINKLLREKHHWENQIIALGGANYKRAAGKMLDGEGKEVPGARGYKYFGRAKDLPGVKELFATTAVESAELESHKTQKFNMFKNVGSDYYGDEDEKDGQLLEYEAAAETEGWEDALENLREEYSVSIPKPPPVPRAKLVSLDDPSENTSPEDPQGPVAKRKASAVSTTANKKAKLDATSANTNGFMSVLKADDLRPPTLMTEKQMEDYIISRQKARLLSEYGA